MEVIMNKNQKDGNFEENLGSRVKKLRQEMNLTQAEVADALHVTPGYISNVENNRTAMSLRILIYYAKLMNTTLDSLVGSLEPAYKENALDNEVTKFGGAAAENLGFRRQLYVYLQADDCLILYLLIL